MVLSSKEWLDKMDEIIAAIQNNGGDSQVIMDMLSNMWSSSVTYNVGDYVLYNNNIWKCLVQNSNIAPTEGSTWTKVIITNEISTLNNNLIGKMNKYANTTFTSTSDLSDEKISKLDTGVYTLRCQSVHSDFKDTDGTSIWGFGTLTVSGVLNGYKSYLYITAKGGLYIRHFGYDTWHTGWIKVK